MRPENINLIFAPVAQLDRVSDSDSEGRAFESHQAYQKETTIFDRKLSFLFVLLSFHFSLFTLH